VGPKSRVWLMMWWLAFSLNLLPTFLQWFNECHSRSPPSRSLFFIIISFLENSHHMKTRGGIFFTSQFNNSTWQLPGLVKYLVAYKRKLQMWECSPMEGGGIIIHLWYYYTPLPLPLPLPCVCVTDLMCRKKRDWSDLRCRLSCAILRNIFLHVGKNS